MFRRLPKQHLPQQHSAQHKIITNGMMMVMINKHMMTSNLDMISRIRITMDMILVGILDGYLLKVAIIIPMNTKLKTLAMQFTKVMSRLTME